jgi:outer membrane protein assembly factor BamB
MLLALLCSVAAGIVVSPVWNTSGVDASSGGAALATYRGRSVVVVLNGTQLQAVDASTGGGVPDCAVTVQGRVRGTMYVEQQTGMVVYATLDGQMHGWRLCEPALAWSSGALGGGFYFGLAEAAADVALLLTGDSGGSTISAVDTASGKLLWSAANKGVFPAVGCGAVWTLEASTVLVARDPHTGVPSGVQVALKRTPDLFTAAAFRCGTAALPLIVFYSCRSSDGGAHGLCADGGASWQHYPFFQNFTPYMWPAADPLEPDAVYATSGDSWIRGFDASSGKLRWRSGVGTTTQPPILPTSGSLAHDHVIAGSLGGVIAYSRSNGTVLWAGPPMVSYAAVAYDASSDALFVLSCNSASCDETSLLHWRTSGAVQGPQSGAVIVRERWNNTVCAGAGSQQQLKALPCDNSDMPYFSMQRSCTPFGAMSTTRYTSGNCQGGVVETIFDYPERNVVFESAYCRQTVWGSYVLLSCDA